MRFSQIHNSVSATIPTINVIIVYGEKKPNVLPIVDTDNSVADVTKIRIRPMKSKDVCFSPFDSSTNSRTTIKPSTANIALNQ